MIDVGGSVYLLHFLDPATRAPFRVSDHAGHYIGWSGRGIDSRLAYHRRGDGSRLLRALCVDAGMDFVIALTLPGDRALERRLKRRKMILCPVCRGDATIRSSSSSRIFVQFRPRRRALYERWAFVA